MATTTQKITFSYKQPIDGETVTLSVDASFAESVEATAVRNHCKSLAASLINLSGTYADIAFTTTAAGLLDSVQPAYSNTGTPGKLGFSSDVTLTSCYLDVTTRTDLLNA